MTIEPTYLTEMERELIEFVRTCLTYCNDPLCYDKAKDLNERYGWYLCDEVRGYVPSVAYLDEE